MQATNIEEDDQLFRLHDAADCGVTIAELDSGGTYKRGVPLVRGPRISWMPSVLTQMAAEIVTPPPARVVAFDDATVRGPGIITLPGRKIVRESLINCHDVEVVGALERLGDGTRYAPRPEFAEAERLPPGTYVLLKQIWDLNYGHWIVECLPRVALLEQSMDLSQCKFVVSFQHAAMERVFRDSLATFGIGPDQVFITDWEPYQFDRLIFPLPLTVQPWVKAPFAIRALERAAARVVAGAGETNAPKRLFLHRPESSRRPMRNQDAVADLLRGRGYNVITPGEMSFEEQVVAFSNATHVVGTLGAECANIAFSPSGVRLLGFAPEDMQDDFFYDLVSHKQGRYFCVHGRSEDTAAGMNSPFAINLDLLELMLRDFEAG